jgi:two-component system, cell cycle response regulator
MNVKVLLVDDNQLNIRLMEDILLDENYLVHTVMNGVEVLPAAKDFKPDIILLDIMMPGLDGYDVCRLLKKDFDCKNIPVIMVTAKTEGSDIKKALELGAFDYIKKPVDEVEVIARIQSALRYKENFDRLQEMAMKDGLTGVYNHALLIELLGKEYIKAKRKGTNLAFVMLDIDYFKQVNDTYGHISGDIVLKQLCSILQDTVRESDIIGRYGGEEFGIVFPEISPEDVKSICERIRSNIETHSFSIGARNINITASIGICLKTSSDTLSKTDMIKFADKALYQAKDNGRNRVV